MNRLLLIGNGFDLAHGLKTSYKDFITDYLFSAITEFYRTNRYDDELINISYKSHGNFLDGRKVEYDFDDIREHIKYIKKNNLTDSEFKYKSKFFEGLISKCHSANWVDIEIEYFNTLLSYKAAYNFIDFQVIALNKEFNYLKSKLEDYLSNSGKIGIPNKISAYIQIFCQPIYKDEIVTITLENDKIPNKIHLLNFNYTNTFEQYYNTCCKSIQTEVNFIHGELGVESNRIIFGFGDEHNEDYKKFENHNDKKLFTHIKSFGYYLTKNYHDLVRFTDSDDFQVFIIGHSCGLSDRTMLKHIFEHKKCRSIKIFHHLRADGSDDFTEKTYDIARHFTDKGDMRLKLVSFNPINNMPQFTK